jgi:hypothetical protein
MFMAVEQAAGTTTLPMPRDPASSMRRDRRLTYLKPMAHLITRVP